MLDILDQNYDESDIEEIISFENSLINISKNILHDGGGKDLSTYNISKLSNQFPFLMWADFFQSAFIEANISFSVSPSTEVLLQVYTV